MHNTRLMPRRLLKVKMTDAIGNSIDLMKGYKIPSDWCPGTYTFYVNACATSQVGIRWFTKGDVEIGKKQEITAAYDDFIRLEYQCDGRTEKMTFDYQCQELNRNDGDFVVGFTNNDGSFTVINHNEELEFNGCNELLNLSIQLSAGVSKPLCENDINWYINNKLFESNSTTAVMQISGNSEVKIKQDCGREREIFRFKVKNDKYLRAEEDSQENFSFDPNEICQYSETYKVDGTGNPIPYQVLVETDIEHVNIYDIKGATNDMPLVITSDNADLTFIPNQILNNTCYTI